eukprot:NODE_262_length_1564_cov_4.591419_g187_i0.p1 GENE.NODE_262_length_1564_cov_4.591419_g187_i0~~NODE_262_length_1564_cov_4.591419_g187_i0.p1  ORF type:complete len:446 (-),score=116.13 NODE_262_length_1564_cov_4.591419_g187_i0:118-1455(-)
MKCCCIKLHSSLVCVEVCSYVCLQAALWDCGFLMEAAADDCAFRTTYPKQYVAYRVTEPPTLDGRLDDPAWTEVAWTTDFLDISGPTFPTPRYRTAAKIRWDDEYLYVAAWLEEPDVWANLTARNSVVFHDNDFEIFLSTDGTHHYYKEFEVNALNTVWNLMLNRPYLNGGGENSSRVFGAQGYDIDCRTAVHIDGSLNDLETTDRGWSVEVALPLDRLNLNNLATLPPRHGQYWRIDFSRVEWRVRPCPACRPAPYEKLPGREDNWVYAATGHINMHMPEYWAYLQFSTAQVNTSEAVPDPDWTVRHLAMQLYEAQLAYRHKHSKYTANLSALSELTPISGVLELACHGDIGLTVAEDGRHYNASVPSVPDSEGCSDRVAHICSDRFLTVDHPLCAQTMLAKPRMDTHHPAEPVDGDASDNSLVIGAFIALVVCTLGAGTGYLV